MSSHGQLGRHLLFDFFECDRARLDDKAFLRDATIEAARRAEATIVADVFHEFNPQGLSGVVVIAESHVAIHTWPEHGVAAVDVFSCGDGMKPEVVGAYLQDVLGARRMTTQEVRRGGPQYEATSVSSRPTARSSTAASGPNENRT